MNPITTERPWGSFVTFTKNEESTVKILQVKKGEEFSLQYHKKREEFWRVLAGHPMVTIGEKVFEAKEGDEFSVGVGVRHRVSSPEDDSFILEISMGEFDEDDIVRIEDKYNRV